MLTMVAARETIQFREASRCSTAPSSRGMLPLNAGANYVLMTGAGPVSEFGPTGAALATLLVATITIGASLALNLFGAPFGFVALLGQFAPAWHQVKNHARTELSPSPARSRRSGC